RQALGVRDVAEVAGAEADDHVLAMRHGERKHGEAGDLHGLAGADHGQAHVRLGGPFDGPVLGIEDVGEPLVQRAGAVLAGVRGQRLIAPHGEGAQVVHAVGVVRVAVGEPDRVDVRHAGGEELEPQLGRRVHQDAARAVIALEERGVPRAAVPRVRRRANGAVAPDDRDSERGAGAEERQPHSWTTRTVLVVPRTSNGMPAVTATRSPGFASPLPTRYSLAQASSDSNVASPGQSTGWTPQTSASWRNVVGWLLTPRMGTGGR